MVFCNAQRSVRRKARGIVQIVLSFAALAAHAQTASTTDGGLDEIVVTAQKRGQNLEDVGISITAVNGDEIRASGAKQLTDLLAQMPGVSFISLHPANASFNIRGVSQNDFADHYEPPVALFVDDAYVPHAAAVRAQMFDLAQVEVLRGPQGTLFGRNATGGLVQETSQQPTSNAQGFVSVSYGSYDLRNIEAALGGPITDAFRTRVAFTGTEQNGWFYNRIGPDLNNQHNYAGRVIMEYDVAPATTINVKIHDSINDHESGQGFNQTPTVENAQGLGTALGANQIGQWPNIVTGGVVVGRCPGCDIEGYKEPDNNPYTGSVSYGNFNRHIYGTTVKLTSKFGEVGFTSITDYLHLTKDLDGDPDGAPEQFFRYITTQRSRDWTQEFRFDGAGDRYRWQAGVYYLDTNSDYSSSVDLDLSPYLGLPNGSYIANTTTTWNLRVKSGAIFSQGEYDITPSVTAILGARYTDDHKEVNALFNDSELTGNPATPFNTALYPNLAKRVFANESARAQLNWRVVDDWLLYVSFNRGYKGGNWAMPVFGLNPDPTIRAKVDFPGLEVGPETLLAYEIGAKGRFWANKAQLNTSIFYYDYQNYQVFSLQNAEQKLFNRNASVSGGEAELSVRPWRRLNVNLGVAALWEARVFRVPLPLGTADQDMPLSPDLTANASVRYGWDIGPGILAVQGDIHWTDSFYFYAVNAPITKQGAYQVTNARLSYGIGEKWDVALWVKNLTQTQYENFKLDVGSLGYCGCAIAPPRMVGGTFTYHWN